MKFNSLVGTVGMAVAMSATSAMSADWSTSNFEYRRGSSYNDNGSTGGPKFSKDILQFENVSGFDWGRSYYFLSMAKSDNKDAGYSELYSEGSVYLSLSKALKRDFSFGFIKDANLNVGYNFGSKNSAFGSNPKVLTYGLGVELDVPKFSYFNVDIAAFRDVGTYSGFGGGKLCGRNSTTYQITPYWSAPIRMGNFRFVFDGYMDIIGAHGSCSQQVLTQIQLKLDVGNFWGKPDSVYMGVEYQYWKNKFGNSANTERVPQFVINWTL